MSVAGVEPIVCVRGHHLPMLPVNDPNARSRLMLTTTLRRTGAGRISRLLMRAASFLLVRVVTLQIRREAIQRAAPHVVQPRADGAEPFRIDLVDTPCAGGGVPDQPGRLQNGQMLRYRRPGDRDPTGELAHGARPGPQSLEQLPPGRIGKSGEGGRG